MTLEQAERIPGVVRVGWITLTISALSLLRIVPEGFAVGRDVLQDYVSLLLVDCMLLLAGLVAGAGLIDQPTWGWRLALMFWGALSLNSSMIGVWMIDLGLNRDSRGDILVLLPRLAIYGVILASTPLALFTLMVDGADGRPSRGMRLKWLVAGIGTGGILGLVVTHPNLFK